MDCATGHTSHVTTVDSHQIAPLKLNASLHRTKRPTLPDMPAANDIRKGQVIKFNGEPHLVMETQHRTPGNLRAFVQIKMRNLRYGKALDQRFASTDTIEVLPTDKRTLEFTYADRDAYAFIDPSTFDQIELSAQTPGHLKNYLTPAGKADVLFVN